MMQESKINQVGQSQGQSQVGQPKVGQSQVGQPQVGQSQAGQPKVGQSQAQNKSAKLTSKEMLEVNAKQHAMFFSTNMAKLSEDGEWEIKLGKSIIKVSKIKNDPDDEKQH